MSAGTAPAQAPVVLDGTGLSCEKVRAVAREDAYGLAAAALDSQTAHRPLDADVDAAERRCPHWAPC